MYSMFGKILNTQANVRFFNFCSAFFFKQYIFRSEHQEANQHAGVGIIENLESETNEDDQLLNETIVERVQDLNQTDVDNGRVTDVLDDVFDKIDNIEETAAKVLYGLQNMDRTESPQSFSVTIGQPTREIKSEFLNYTNFIAEKQSIVSTVFSNEFQVHFRKW